MAAQSTGSQAASQPRVVMISGANRGIGLAIATRLAGEGYHLSLGVRNIAAMPAVHVNGGEVSTHQWDAREAGSGARWVSDTIARHGRIDALVNNAGVLYPFGVESDDEDKLDDMWLVNVKAPLRLIRAAMPSLRASGRGRVVNIVSLSGKRVKGDAIAGYAMTKHALLALTHAVRYSGWPDGVRSTAICPGFVATDMAASITSKDPAEMIQPESVAELVAVAIAADNSASMPEITINPSLEHSY